MTFDRLLVSYKGILGEWMNSNAILFCILYQFHFHFRFLFAYHFDILNFLSFKLTAAENKPCLGDGTKS